MNLQNYGRHIRIATIVPKADLQLYRSMAWVASTRLHPCEPLSYSAANNESLKPFGCSLQNFKP
jgi:hypothetical protein